MFIVRHRRDALLKAVRCAFSVGEIERKLDCIEDHKARGSHRAEGDDRLVSRRDPYLPDGSHDTAVRARDGLVDGEVRDVWPAGDRKRHVGGTGLMGSIGHVELVDAAGFRRVPPRGHRRAVIRGTCGAGVAIAVAHVRRHIRRGAPGAGQPGIRVVQHDTR